MLSNKIMTDVLNSLPLADDQAVAGIRDLSVQEVQVVGGGDAKGKEATYF